MHQNKSVINTFNLTDNNACFVLQSVLSSAVSEVMFEKVGKHNVKVWKKVTPAEYRRTHT